MNRWLGFAVSFLLLALLRSLNAGASEIAQTPLARAAAVERKVRLQAEDCYNGT